MLAANVRTDFMLPMSSCSKCSFAPAASFPCSRYFSTAFFDSTGLRTPVVVVVDLDFFFSGSWKPIRFQADRWHQSTMRWWNERKRIKESFSECCFSISDGRVHIFVHCLTECHPPHHTTYDGHTFQREARITQGFEETHLISLRCHTRRVFSRSANRCRDFHRWWGQFFRAVCRELCRENGEKKGKR